MATYKSNVIANTWTSFINKKLSAQGKSIAAGTEVTGQEAGESDTGDMVIRFGNLYSKRKWFDVIPDAPSGGGGGTTPPAEEEYATAAVILQGNTAQVNVTTSPGIAVSVIVNGVAR